MSFWRQLGFPIFSDYTFSNQNSLYVSTAAGPFSDPTLQGKKPKSHAKEQTVPKAECCIRKLLAKRGLLYIVSFLDFILHEIHESQMTSGAHKSQHK